MKYEQSDGQLRVQDLGETFVYSEQRVQVYVQSIKARESRDGGQEL